MDISNLHADQVIPSFKDLCLLLNRPEMIDKTGSSRISFKKELERFCDYELIKGKFYIYAIYDEPIPKKYSHNSIWVEDISLCILKHLAQAPREEGKDLTTVFIERYKLIIYVGLCNEYFYYNRSNYNESPDKKERSDIEKRFFSTATSKFSSIMDSVLKSMEKRHDVFFDAKAWLYSTNELKDIEARDEIKARIFEEQGIAKDQVNKELEGKARYETVRDVEMSRHKNKYRKILNDNLKEKHGIFNAKPIIKFIFSDNIHQRIQELADKTNYDERLIATNKKSVDFFIKKTIEYVEKGVYISFPDFKTGITIPADEMRKNDLIEYQSLIDENILIFSEDELETEEPSEACSVTDEPINNCVAVSEVPKIYEEIPF